MVKTLYLNLEDDVAKVVAKIKRERTADVVLVFPKKSYVFSDSINMRLPKKQVDMLGKQVSILTMDERGQEFAKEAGFALKIMPKMTRGKTISDIRPRTAPTPAIMTQGFQPEAVIAPESTQSIVEDEQPVLEPMPIEPLSAPVAKPKKAVRRPKAAKTEAATTQSVPVVSTPVKPVKAKPRITTVPPVIPSHGRVALPVAQGQRDVNSGRVAGAISSRRQVAPGTSRSLPGSDLSVHRAFTIGDA